MTGSDGETVVLTDGGSVVEIRYVRRGASTSVQIADVGTGDTIILDATELESLARAPEGVLRGLLLDPARDR